MDATKKGRIITKSIGKENFKNVCYYKNSNGQWQRRTNKQLRELKKHSDNRKEKN